MFQLSSGQGYVQFRDDDKSFSMERWNDGDIWFISKEELEFSISFYSRNRLEWKSYCIFENLMKLIIGRCVLNNDYDILPKDFIDLENKIITLHSDGGSNNILKFQFTSSNIIVNMFSLDNKTRDVRVRIRTSGSNYGFYYQEFEKIFMEFMTFTNQISDNNKLVKKR